MKPIHIVTEKENISPLVLMPGDPLRAKYIAENYLEDYKLVNKVRNMLGYTGMYKGKRITVMASGMGCPSMGIYSYELAKFYDVKKIIRIGTSGSLNRDVKIGDIVVGVDATSLDSFAYSFSQDDNKTQPADKELLEDIKATIGERKNVYFGHILTSDIFDVYSDITPTLNKLNLYDPAAVEMEAFALYHVGKITNIQTATMVTVVDSKFDPEAALSPEERQNNLNDMIELALDAIVK